MLFLKVKFLTKPTIYILDDDLDLVSLTIKMLDPFDVTIQKYTDPQKLLENFDGSLEGCLLLDFYMPSMNGAQVLEKIKGWLPIFPVVIISAGADMPMTLAAMKSGVFHLLQKPLSEHDLIEQVGNALSWSKNIRLKNTESLTIWSAMQKLSPREKQVLDLILEGLASREIGVKLSISRFTADHHRANILSKLGLPTIGALLTQVTRAKTVFERDRLAPHIAPQ